MTTEAEPSGSSIDARVIMAEVRAEVRRRRASGEIPPAYERDLDLAFARLAPPGAVGDDLDAVLERAERASHIDVDVPTGSARPGVSVAKSGLRRMMAWYLRYLAQQTSAFASVSTSGLRLLAARLEAVEHATPATSARVAAELDLLDLGDDALAAGWSVELVARTAEVEGRILHAEAAQGSLLRALVTAGRDAYGVEPRRHLADQASVAGLDVRPDGALAHLGHASVGSLGAVVLSGVVERRPVPELLELVDLAVSRLSTGGMVCVLSRRPGAAGASAAAAVVADLSPGRPLQPETWAHLLGVRGLGETEVLDGAEGSYAVMARRRGSTSSGR